MHLDRLEKLDWLVDPAFYQNLILKIISYKTSASHRQFHWNFWTTNSFFWLVNIHLRKFNTLSKKEMKMIKTQLLWWKTNKKKRFRKADANTKVTFLFVTDPTDWWCYILETLEERRNVKWYHFVRKQLVTGSDLAHAYFDGQTTHGKKSLRCKRCKRF